MSDIFLFKPKAELDASQNLRRFIDSCRNELTVFGADLPFDENVWDITDSINLKGHGNKRHRLVFSNLETVNDKAPAPMAESFLSFAKAYFRYMQGFRPIVGVGPRLVALRALEAALRVNGGDAGPARADILIFNRAAQMIVEKYTEAAAYRMGGQLEMLADFLTDNKLTTVPARWRNFIKRPGDAVRVGKEFDERRKEKMPSQAALDALPQIFRNAVEPIDVIVSSAAAMMCASPDRISELLSLPLDCEVRQKNKKTGEEAYGLRWWPAKGADPMIKWVVPSMASVVQEAIEKIRKVTDEARRIAKWYEGHPGKIYLVGELEYLRGQEWVSMQELAGILGMSERAGANTWCKTNRIDVIKKEQGKIYVRLSDVEKVIIGMLPRDFPLLDKETGCKYSEALFVVRVNQLHAQRGTYNCQIEPITINQINTGLGGRTEHGFASIFSRFGFIEPDGSPINISTHQFRHYLNTLAQAGGLSQLDIAKWSGRKDIRQNAAYDHVTPGQMVQKIRDAIGDDSTMFGPLAELAKKTLIPRDEFARLVVPTAHTTELGYCIHDYTMSPCQQHRDCINCTDLICVKGDEEKERRLRQQLEEARDLLRRAEEATKDGYYGSDRWLEHHTSTVERLSQLCSIIDDPKVPIGAVIQLSQPKSVMQQVTMQRRLESVEEMSHAPASQSSTATITGE
ncbi:MAG: integrase [Methylophilaceae bacterium]|nr:integrase [Methylophilaceae bacterium]